MKIFIILISIIKLFPVYGMSVDSTKWPLPDSTILQFTIYGQFHNYHVQNDGMGHNGPNNYDQYSNSSIAFPTLRISRTDSIWSFSETDQSLNYSRHISPYPYLQDNTDVQITLDTVAHLIRSLSYHYHYAVVPEESDDYVISCTGIKYSQLGLLVEDSDITKNLLSSSYSERNGLHSTDYGGSDLVKTTKVNISGSLNYNLLGVGQPVPKVGQLIVQYLPNRITILLPPENHNNEVKLYSFLGVLVKKVRVENGSANFDVNGLAQGIYFLLADNLSTKVLIR